MNDNLQNTLAELADGLGTSSGELWNWMKGDGIEAYAKVQVAQSWVYVATIAAFMVALMAIAFAIYRFWKSDKYRDFDMLMIEELCPFIFLVVCAVGLVQNISNLVGWIASPEGMVIQKFLEMVK